MHRVLKPPPGMGWIMELSHFEVSVTGLIDAVSKATVCALASAAQKIPNANFIQLRLNGHGSVRYTRRMPSLEHPMILRTTKSEFTTDLVMAFGALLVAFLLFRYPDFLWKPLLGYIAGTLVGIVGLFWIWGAFYTKSFEIHADQSGVEVKDSDGGHRFSWSDVAALRHETITQDVVHKNLSQDMKNFGTRTTEEVAHYLILLDAAGKELLKLNEDSPMQPFDDWIRLREFIPSRTGLVVEQITKKSILGERQGF